MTACHRRGRAFAARLIILLVLTSASTVRAEDWSYTLRPGDDLWRVAQRFCGEIASAAKIAQHNGIQDPSLVRAGQRINIPTDWLVFEPATAKITAASGDVRISRGTTRTVQQVPARVGDVLQMGQLLTTGEGSALVEFADGSTLALKPNSEVLFNKLTMFGPAGMVDTHLRFAYGRGTATVQPQNQGDRFRIATPEGVAAVRGTEFRIGHQGDAGEAVSNTETLEGHVDFEAPAQTTDLPSGFGVAVSGTNITREALLAAPSFSDLSNVETTSGASISWRPLPDAAAYVATWHDAQTPGTTAAQLRTKEPMLRVDVPVGSYELAVRGVSASGVEGFDAKRTLNVREPGPINLKVTADTSGDVHFSWAYPDGSPGDQATITLDADHWEEPLELTTTGNAVTTVLEPGRYRWQVKTASSAASSQAQFDLAPPSPTNLTATSKRRSIAIAWDGVADAQRYEVRVTSTSGSGTEIVQDVTADARSANVEVPEFGTYQIAVYALANGQRSSPAVTEDQVQRRPWWLLILGAVILAL